MTKIVMISSHELNAPYCPYSDVDSRRVKIGVVIVDMPFCMKEQIKNQNDARTCTGNDRYFARSLCITIPSPCTYDSCPRCAQFTGCAGAAAGAATVKTILSFARQTVNDARARR